MLMSTLKPLGELENPSEFIARHIGISAADEQHMLSVIGEASRRALIESIVPRSIARAQAMVLPAPLTEAAALAELKTLAQKKPPAQKPHRSRLLRHAHAWRDPAQHSGKSRLVHRVHTLPS
jgi:hypothetical protein